MTNAVYNGLNKFYEMRKGQMENKEGGSAKVEVKSSYDYQTLAGDLKDLPQNETQINSMS